MKNRLKEMMKKYGHIWILGYFAIYLPWFIYLEKTVTTRYYVMHSALDDLIPFSEYFIVPYLLWFVYIAAAILWFFFTNREDYYKLCIFLFTGMTLSLLICTLYPNGTDFRPEIDPEKNIFAWAVARIYQTDTCTNVFPSIHVYNSLAVHIGIMKSERLKKYRAVRILSGILMVSICLSTVFLKQHSVIDVAGAILLCGAVYPLAYASTSQGNAARGEESVLIR